jgi:hypothetical protein
MFIMLSSPAMAELFGNNTPECGDAQTLKLLERAAADGALFGKEWYLKNMQNFFADDIEIEDITRYLQGCQYDAFYNVEMSEEGNLRTCIGIITIDTKDMSGYADVVYQVKEHKDNLFVRIKSASSINIQLFNQ